MTTNAVENIAFPVESLLHAPVSVHECITLVDRIKFHAKNRADKTMATWIDRQGAVVDQMSFGQLHLRACALAALLDETRTKTDASLRSDDSEHSLLSALIVCNPGFDFIVSLVACFYAGVAAVPAYPLRRQEEYERFQAVLIDSDASIVIADDANHSWLSNVEGPATDGGPALLHVNYRELDLRATPVATNPAAESVALIQYTSGSTGQPKGVMVTHDNLMSNQRLIQQAMNHDQSLVVASWLPMFHDMGLIGNLLQPLFVGGQGVYLSPVDFVVRPFRWLEAISEFRATSSGGPNFGYQHCIDRIAVSDRKGLDLSCWKNAYNGSEPVSAETLMRFSSAFADSGFNEQAFLPCYGMAETTLFISGVNSSDKPKVLHADRAEMRRSRLKLLVEADSASGFVAGSSVSSRPPEVQSIVSCGEPRDAITVKIVNPVTRRELNEGEVGEIWVAGDSVAMGYKDRPELNEANFQARIASDRSESTGELSEPVLKRKFLRTGDIGFLWNRELYISGRLKELIVVRGRNHYPHDIEQTVRNSDACLTRCSFAAVALPDGETESLGLVVSTRNSGISEEDREHLQRRMVESVSRVHDLRLCKVAFTNDRLPVTTSGKIKRLQCRHNYFGESATG